MNSTGNDLREKALTVASLIGEGNEDQIAKIENFGTDESKAALLGLFSSEEFSDNFVEALFRFGNSNASEQVTTLDKFQRLIGRGENSNEIISHLWAALFASENGKLVLEELLNRHVSFVFRYLESLVLTLGSFDVPADTLGPWLCSVRRIMGSDFAAGQLYRIVDSVIQRNPEVAIQILEGIQVDDEIGTRDMHSAFLGKLRATQRKGELGGLADRVTAIDTLSRQSKDRETSISYITSWIETAWGGQITLEDCRLLFDAYCETSVQLRETVVWTYSRILRTDTIDESIITLLIDTLSSRSSSDATDVEKQAIIDASTLLLKQEKFKGDDWLISILPIQSDAEWAWMQIEDYVVDRSSIDSDWFEKLFIQIAEKSGKEWLSYIDRRLEKSRLYRDAPDGVLSSLATKFLVSRTREARRVGFTLFEGISELLPFSAVEKWSESDFSLALMEARREYMQGATGARYYVSLAQGIENRSPHYQDVLREEMEYFAINHGKSCRDYFEEKKSDFKILESVMANVDEQYEELKAGVSSPARQMQVPGFRKAELLHLRKFGEGVAEGVKKNSLVEFLCGRPHMLTYGRSFRIYQGGELGEASALHHSSTSIEIPIGEFTDPELAALRRIQASAEINLICSEEADCE